jgi:hypothetical protein
VVLAGFTDITDDFMDRNRAQWANVDLSWPTENNFKLDGYTLYFSLEISDTNAVAVCIQ